MKTLEIKRIDNLEEAKDVWNKLTPDISIRDNWDFRYCFYKYFNYPLYFYAGYDKGEVIGLLPLQYNKEKKYLEFFGGNFMDNNRVFIKSEYEKYIPQFYSTISQSATLKNIAGDDPFTESFDVYKYKYVGDLSGIDSADDYLIKQLKAKPRQGMRKKIKMIKALNPEIIENNFSDFDLLIELNKKAFGEKSLFYKPYKIESYKDFLKMNFDIYMFSYIINRKKEAVSFSVKYKDAYVYINAGTNKVGVPNLGTFNIYYNLDKAISSGVKKFDAGLGDLGWKERWHLKKIPQRIFIKE